MRQTILIAGAGPSGLMAAILLARSGQDVIVVAPRQQGHKVGECVPGAINRLLAKHDLPRITHYDHVHRKIGGAISWWAGQRRREDYLNSLDGYSWRLNRTAFENQLEGIAIESGAQRKIGRVVRLSKNRDDRWQVHLDDGESRVVDQLLDATGRSAMIARNQGASFQCSAPLVGLWSVGKTSSSCSTGRTLIESDEEGWWYAAFLPNQRPLAIYHTSPDQAVRSKEDPSLWTDKLKATKLISDQIPWDLFDGQPRQVANARSCWTVHCFGARWVACGDAAMALDPISSQGIFNALATGAMAADAMVGSDRETLLMRYYERVSQIREIYRRRRRAYYQSGAQFYGSPFWQQQSLDQHTCKHRPPLSDKADRRHMNRAILANKPW